MLVTMLESGTVRVTVSAPAAPEWLIPLSLALGELEHAVRSALMSLPSAFTLASYPYTRNWLRTCADSDLRANIRVVRVVSGDVASLKADALQIDERLSSVESKPDAMRFMLSKGQA